jgi:hypothetical protein
MTTMRNPILLKQAEAVDEVELEARCAKVVACFDRYLDHYPSKNRKSKHGVMGPVARVIDLIKVKGASAEHAVGFALRMHEMNPRAKGYVSREAVEELETGTRELLALVAVVPTVRLPRTLERIDYALYFQRRKKGIAWFEDICKSFAKFAATRGGTFSPSFNFPSRAPGKLAELTDAQREVVADFWTERPDLERAEADEDEEEAK